MTAASQQKDLFTKRWRKVKRLDPSEVQIQISLIDNLKIRCRPGVTYFHVANGEERDPRVAKLFPPSLFDAARLANMRLANGLTI